MTQFSLPDAVACYAEDPVRLDLPSTLPPGILCSASTVDSIRRALVEEHLHRANQLPAIALHERAVSAFANLHPAPISCVGKLRKRRTGHLKRAIAITVGMHDQHRHADERGVIQRAPDSPELATILHGAVGRLDLCLAWTERCFGPSIEPVLRQDGSLSFRRDAV